MKEQKNIQDKELNSVNGGTNFGNAGSDITAKTCTSCKKSFSMLEAESREAGSGCSKYKEYKCPHCGTWN